MDARLETPRLTLRPPTLADAADIQRLIGDWAVARMLARVSYPYTEGMAEKWIQSVSDGFDTGRTFVLALERRSDQAFLGIVSIERNDNDDYVLGYWLGRPHWGQGYMSEAAPCAIRHVFEEGGVEGIVAVALPENAASIAILRRLGMRDEGRAVVEWPARDEHREVVRFTLRRQDFCSHG